MERKFEVTENALWKRRGKAIVSKNLNRWRRCPSLASVLREMNRCVVEYQSDDDLIFYDVGLYKLIQSGNKNSRPLHGLLLCLFCLLIFGPLLFCR